MIQIIKDISTILGAISTLISLSIIVIKPIRNKIFNKNAEIDAIKCLLRSQIVNLYYKHIDDKQLQRYEFENLIELYKGYKALKGNSFVERLYNEMMTWEII